MTSGSWAVVVPVKGRHGKSRLAVPDALRAQLARAFALDTVRAVAETGSVREIVVVAADGGEAGAFGALGARLVRDPGAGLLAALGTGLHAVRDRRLGRALLLGDLPALRSAELAAALAAAARLPRAMVPDTGTGTVLVTARAGVAHRPRFGPGSGAAHRRAGYVELALPRDWGLRNDVDTLADLARARSLGLGSATTGVLRSAGQVIG